MVAATNSPVRSLSLGTRRRRRPRQRASALYHQSSEIFSLVLHPQFHQTSHDISLGRRYERGLAEDALDRLVQGPPKTGSRGSAPARTLLAPALGRTGRAWALQEPAMSPVYVFIHIAESPVHVWTTGNAVEGARRTRYPAPLADRLPPPEVARLSRLTAFEVDTRPQAGDVLSRPSGAWDGRAHSLRSARGCEIRTNRHPLVRGRGGHVQRGGSARSRGKIRVRPAPIPVYSSALAPRAGGAKWGRGRGEIVLQTVPRGAPARTIASSWTTRSCPRSSESRPS